MLFPALQPTNAVPLFRLHVAYVGAATDFLRTASTDGQRMEMCLLGRAPPAAGAPLSITRRFPRDKQRNLLGWGECDVASYEGGLGSGRRAPMVPAVGLRVLRLRLEAGPCGVLLESCVCSTPGSSDF